MTKIKLEIIALADKEVQSNSFLLMLKEIDGNRRLPVIIGAFEAQAIAIAIENIRPERPLTHDLLHNMLVAMNAEIEEVTITSLKNGVFHSVVRCTLSDGRSIEVDARTSDAVAIAVRFKCPIYVYPAILEEAGIVFEEQTPQNAPHPASGLTSHSTERLEKMLEEALEQEAYERAVEIRDEINKRKA